MNVADMTEAEFQAYLAQLSQGYEAPAPTVDAGVAWRSPGADAAFLRSLFRVGPVDWVG
jgi:hypothetical protein